MELYRIQNVYLLTRKTKQHLFAGPEHLEHSKTLFRRWKSDGKQPEESPSAMETPSMVIFLGQAQLLRFPVLRLGKVWWLWCCWIFNSNKQITSKIKGVTGVRILKNKKNTGSSAHQDCRSFPGVPSNHSKPPKEPSHCRCSTGMAFGKHVRDDDHAVVLPAAAGMAKARSAEANMAPGSGFLEGPVVQY